jgi:hypothetical protein
MIDLDPKELSDFLKAVREMAEDFDRRLNQAGSHDNRAPSRAQSVRAAAAKLESSLNRKSG